MPDKFPLHERGARCPSSLVVLLRRHLEHSGPTCARRMSPSSRWRSPLHVAIVIEQQHLLSTVVSTATDVAYPRGASRDWPVARRPSQVYRFRRAQHDPGDELFFFGFSRGAFTARSAAGFVRNAGILRREQRRPRRRGVRALPRQGRRQKPPRRRGDALPAVVLAPGLASGSSESGTQWARCGIPLDGAPAGHVSTALHSSTTRN